VTPDREARTSNGEADSDLTPTYMKVLVLEAAIVAALWIFGRMFS
jgi:hypothetical protein